MRFVLQREHKKGVSYTFRSANTCISHSLQLTKSSNFSIREICSYQADLNSSCVNITLELSFTGCKIVSFCLWNSDWLGPLASNKATLNYINCHWQHLTVCILLLLFLFAVLKGLPHSETGQTGSNLWTTFCAFLTYLANPEQEIEVATHYMGYWWQSASLKLDWEKIQKILISLEQSTK